MNRFPFPCPCCGAGAITCHDVLWRDLIKEWKLSHEETAYVNRQQGCKCDSCGSNLRSMVLAVAITRCFGFRGTLREFVNSSIAQPLQVLEINEAGTLTQFLGKLPGHTLASYPETDISAMSFADASYDLVVHSDTLEHIPNPMKALVECLRVLKPERFCCFTIPIIVGRLTRSRKGLKPSYHGNSGMKQPDYLVHTEYGADMWKDIIITGFKECRLVSLDYPAAQAIIGVS